VLKVQYSPRLRRRQTGYSNILALSSTSRTIMSPPLLGSIHVGPGRFATQERRAVFLACLVDYPSCSKQVRAGQRARVHREWVLRACKTQDFPKQCRTKLIDSEPPLT
jgi:hypothetical protein